MGPVPRRAVAGAKATPAADPDRLPAGGGSPRSAVTSGGSGGSRGAWKGRRSRAARRRVGAAPPPERTRIAGVRHDRRPRDGGDVGRVNSIAAGVAVVLLTLGYLSNTPLVFYSGLFGLAAALAGLSFRRSRRGDAGAVLLLNTLVFLLLGLAIVDAVGAVLRARAESRTIEPVYSFADAEADPSGFERWWKLANTRFLSRRGDLLIDDPSGRNPFLLKPGARVQNHEAVLRVNALGFRGPEISLDKGDRFRIVAVGESTTFGLILLADDRPWPEILQDLITSELSCDKEVEVVNAGIPGFTLANNVLRLQTEIFPLRPDLVVSYHGYNGFHFFLDEIPEVQVRQAPIPPERPSWLLERIETAVRVAAFRKRYETHDDRDEPALLDDFRTSPYSTHYRKLIAMARARNIDLALSNFNLAIDEDSPEEVVRFYERVFPNARSDLFANRLHTLLVRELASEADITFVDATPGLDGEYERYFADLVHFNQAGRERLARNILAGIRGILEADPRTNCRPRRVSPVR